MMKLIRCYHQFKVEFKIPKAHIGEREQNLPPQICLFGIRIVWDWLLLRSCQHKNLWKQSRSCLFVCLFRFIKEISICKGVFLSVPKRRRTKLLKMFINEEGNNLDLYNNLALIGVLFLLTSNWLAPSPISNPSIFPLSLAEDDI